MSATANSLTSTSKFTPATRWLATAAALSAFFSSIFTSSITNIAIPHVMGAFGVGQSQAQFLSTAFLATNITGLLASSWAIGKIGQRTTLLLTMTVFAGGGVVSLGSLVGFVTVLGIAARNAIMLLSHYRHLAVEEPDLDWSEFILRGAEERLAPILMTALTTGLALVPLVLTGELPGQEIEYPMALVILTGLAGATLINLLVLPVLVSSLPASTVRQRPDAIEPIEA